MNLEAFAKSYLLMYSKIILLFGVFLFFFFLPFYKIRGFYIGVVFILPFRTNLWQQCRVGGKFNFVKIHAIWQIFQSYNIHAHFPFYLRFMKIFLRLVFFFVWKIVTIFMMLARDGGFWYEKKIGFFLSEMAKWISYSFIQQI